MCACADWLYLSENTKRKENIKSNIKNEPLWEYELNLSSYLCLTFDIKSFKNIILFFQKKAIKAFQLLFILCSFFSYIHWNLIASIKFQHFNIILCYIFDMYNYRQKDSGHKSLFTQECHFSGWFSTKFLSDRLKSKFTPF